MQNLGVKIWEGEPSNSFVCYHKIRGEEEFSNSMFQDNHEFCSTEWDIYKRKEGKKKIHKLLKKEKKTKREVA